MMVSGGAYMSRAKDQLGDQEYQAWKRRSKRKYYYQPVRKATKNTYINVSSAKPPHIVCSSLKTGPRRIRVRKGQNRPDWKKRIQLWSEHYAEWMDALDRSVVDFYASEKPEDFMEVWRILGTRQGSREAVRNDPLTHIDRLRQQKLTQKTGNLGYIDGLALRWSRRNRISSADFASVFWETAWTTACIYNGGEEYFYGEILRIKLKSRAKDLFRREYKTDKRRVNYETVSLDAVLKGTEIAYHEYVASPESDPLNTILAKDFMFDTRLSTEERHLLKLISEGYTLTEIARKLGKSHHEVIRRSLKRIAKKLE
ncbi:hypothetical protein JZ785_10620 [Alicyclobacillus curvatus]|nr:hypothetical protein JZ785_10620 [Alicyclobacillus curvatus]